MTGPSATCELYVDGIRVDDTVPALGAGHVTALDRLSVDWGRDGQHSQPGPAVCSVSLYDPTPDGAMLDQLHVGSALDVYAAGTIPDAGGDDWLPTFTNDVAAWPAGPLASGIVARLYKTTAAVVDDPDAGRAVRLTPSAPVDAFVIVPPAPYGPVDAWNDLPLHSPPGVPWRFRCRVKAPDGFGVVLRGVWMTGADGAIAAQQRLAPITGTGQWQDVDVLAAAPASALNCWVGLRLDVGDLAGFASWEAQSGTWSTTERSWASYVDDDAAYLTGVNVDRPGLGADRRVLVFSGEVSDVEIAPADDGVATTVKVIAADLAADLANRVVGDVPWNATGAGARASVIANLAGQSTIRFAPTLRDVTVSYRDVDAQPALRLLQDVAQSVGGVLWIGVHASNGPMIVVEDPAVRDPVRRLQLVDGRLVVTGSTAGDVTILSACDLLRDPVRWTQDAGDVVTVAAVGWKEQGTDETGAKTTTDRTETVTDPGTVARFGTRRLSVSTDLTTAADASQLAGRVLALASDVGWRLTGLTLDTGRLPDTVATVTDTARGRALFELLDGTTRLGRAVTLVDMPAYAPLGADSSVYVEGGRYTFTGGAWSLELDTTPAARQGRSATWEQLPPGWTWSAGELTWLDLYGAGPPITPKKGTP